MNWLENYYDDEAPSLNGEYWITQDGSTLYADGDVGDMNHESYVVDYVQRDVAEKSGNYNYEDGSDWDEVVEKITEDGYKSVLQDAINQKDQEKVEELHQMWNDEDNEEFLEAGLKELEIDDEEWEIACGKGDPREYAMIKWKWKRVDDNNIETWNLDQEDMDAICGGVDEILGDTDESTDEKVELYIYVAATGQSHSLTLQKLKEMAGLAPHKPFKLQQDYEPRQPEMPFGKPAPQPFHEPPQTAIQQASRDRYHADIGMTSKSADQHQIDQDKELMDPYYRDKRFPFGDWVIRNGDVL